MSWLGMFPPGQKAGQDPNTININIPNQDNNSRTRRASYKGIETAMAGGLGKVDIVVDFVFFISKNNVL